MTLIEGENREFNRNWISYMKRLNIPVTTDLNTEFEHVFLYEVNKKTLKRIEDWQNRGKTVYFGLEKEEESFLMKQFSYRKKDLEYKNLLYQIIDHANVLFTTLPWLKKELSKKIATPIEVIPKIYDYHEYKVRKSKNKKRKSVLIFDDYYHHLQDILAFTHQFTNFEVIILGFQDLSKMNHKEQTLYYKLNPLVEWESTSNPFVIDSYIKISDIIITFEPFTYSFLLKGFEYRKELFIERKPYLEDYFIHGKHAYLFDDQEELQKQLKKRFDHRTCSLSDQGYDFLTLQEKIQNDKLSKYF